MSDNLHYDKLLATLVGLPPLRKHALEALPGILADLGEGHVTVSTAGRDGIRIAATSDKAVPVGLAVPADGVVAACAQLRQSIYLPDTRANEWYWPVNERTLSVELALPILERSDVVAVLNIEREQQFSNEERHALEMFASGVSERLTERSRASEARMIAALNEKASAALTLEAAATEALAVILPAVTALAGAVLSEWPGRLYPVAVQTPEFEPEPRAALSQGVPYPEGMSWLACLTGEAQLVRDYATLEHACDHLREHLGPSGLAYPVGRLGVNRSVLIMEFADMAEVSEADLEVIGSACDHLARILDSLRATRLQDQLLDLHSQIVESGTPELYQLILETAVSSVPGAESGTMLVRQGAGESFRFRACVGRDLDELHSIELEERDARAWHGFSAQDWRMGKIRILDLSDTEPRLLSIATTERLEPGFNERLGRVKATACLPVIYRGEVQAILCLENFTRDDAFGLDTVQALRQFRMPVAALLQSAHYRDAMQKLALTDAVTGLPNRRGFEEELERVLARSQRSGEPFTLLVMDMHGFKQVNDSLGHHMGDETLRQVSRLLMTARRSGDVVARWGGDEFTALLPAADARAAGRVVQRMRSAVAKAGTRDFQLGIDIGLASYPEDADSAQQLLQVADKRMYECKENSRHAVSSSE